MDKSYLAMKVFLSAGLMLGATASFLIIMRRAKLPHGGYLVRYRYLASVVFISLLAFSLLIGLPELLGAISLPSIGLAFVIIAILGLSDHISLRRRLEGARVEPILISGSRRLLNHCRRRTLLLGWVRGIRDNWMGFLFGHFPAPNWLPGRISARILLGGFAGT